jgi:hypothetical protein
MRTRAKSICNLLTLIALLASLAGAAVTYTPAYAAGVLFAKPAATGSGNCSSWANACTLQTAISSSSAGDEIWVRAGTHLPHASDRTVSFNLLNGVGIYGGFAGTEIQRSQRNPSANVTILSGDLNRDDGQNFTNNSENSFHVVKSVDNDDTAILDGFTIQGGNANSNSAPDFNGGGMLNTSSSPRLTNLIFSGNFAQQGGGMLNASSSPRLTNVTFVGNRVDTATGMGIGGGMASWQNSNPRLTNVTFSGNSASFHGGGMANSNNHLMLINVTFWGNSAQAGGGMFNSDSSPTLINTIIANSPSGGDCVNTGSSTVSPFSSNNLIEDASNTCGLTDGVTGNIIGAAPRLGPLANNGGYTRTHVLLGGSPAIDTGTNQNCPQTDQRRMLRPQGSQCDIGAVEFQTFTITGNAGAPGVKLSYDDGGPKTVTSASNGNYSIIVSDNWSGTVTPVATCYTFSPLKRDYVNVSSNQAAQNYAPSFNPASPCAEVLVKIKGTTETLIVPKNGGERPLLAGVNNGPVLVNGTGKNDVSFITSARVSVPGIFFSEIMGLPKDSLSTKYAFPYYDNVFFNSQLLLVNVSTSAATVRVKIAGTEITSGCTSTPSKPYPYQMGPGTALRVRCAGVNNGPLVVTSSGAKVIASLRVLPKTGGATVSEVIGVPESHLAAQYAFPWYDNKTLNTQLRVANVGTQLTNVRLFIAGIEMNNCTSSPSKPYPYNLPAGAHVRVNCAGVNNGPLKVIGSAGRPIVAAVRIIPENVSTTHFSEVMGLPAGQFTPRHAFPWYDSKQRDTQLRVGNIGTATTQVRLYMGGVEMTGCTSIPPKPYPYNIPANTSLRVSCAGLNRGPVKVIGSAGIPIVASLRILPRNAPPGTVFAELIGLPTNKLATDYVLPWYDSINFSSQLRVAVP